MTTLEIGKNLVGRWSAGHAEKNDKIVREVFFYTTE